MGQTDPSQEKWEGLLAAERHLQSIVRGAVLVGGTAAALHAGHRVSFDGDHVLADLRDRFDAVLTRLEAESGWRTDRLQSPVMILGSLDGFMTGLRQLRRVRPIETAVVAGLSIPTVDEMARIKAWLFLERNTTRDLLDTAALLEKIGESGLGGAFRAFDEIYERGPAGGSPIVELIDRLGAARPADLAAMDLKNYKGVVAPWNDWKHLEKRSRFWASRMTAIALRP